MTITDDDEGDIFEDDEEEDEGYLFAGQGIFTKY
jgi:hypothetical protein